VEVVLVLLALVLAVVGQYLYQQASDARSDRSRAEDKLTDVRRQLGQLVDSESLRAELAQVSAGSASPRFSTQAQALGLGPALFAYADTRGLRISPFTSEKKTVPVGPKTYPAISYTMGLNGPAEALVGALQEAERLVTAVTTQADLTKSESGEEWTLALEVTVYYDQPDGPAN
jgi:hypothetical protein